MAVFLFFSEARNLRRYRYRRPRFHYLRQQSLPMNSDALSADALVVFKLEDASACSSSTPYIYMIFKKFASQNKKKRLPGIP